MNANANAAREATALAKVDSMRLARLWRGQHVTIRGVGGFLQSKAKAKNNNNNNNSEAVYDKKVVRTGYGSNASIFVIEQAPAALGLPCAVSFRLVEEEKEEEEKEDNDCNSNNSNSKSTTKNQNQNQKQKQKETTRAAAARAKKPNANNNNNNNRRSYLTNIMYGDEHRQSAANTLAAVPDLLPDNIPTIIDFAIGRPSQQGDFEGPGFNYSPMTVQPEEEEEAPNNTVVPAAGSSSFSRPQGRRQPPTKLQLFELESVPGDVNQFGVRSLFGTYWRSAHWNHTVSQSPHRLGDETWYFSRTTSNNNSNSNNYY